MNLKLWLSTCLVMLSALCVGCGQSPLAAQPLPTQPLPTQTTSRASQTCDMITLYYHERAHFSATNSQGIPEGLTATPAGLAFEKAGIDFQWQETPFNRALEIVQENQGCDCGVGWLKNPEREALGKFSLLIYQDKPQIAITYANHPFLKDEMTLDELLSNPDLVLGFKLGYSYGSALDEKIAQLQPRTDVTTASNTEMLQQIQAKRFDYFFLAPEEADSAISSSGLRKEDFQYITIPDMPPGLERYIMCSLNVSDSNIERLNGAIEEIVP